MNKPLKKCIHHGNLDKTQVVKAGKRKDLQLYKCKACLKKLHADHYINNREKYDSRQKQYRLSKKDKVNEWRRKYYEKYCDRDRKKKSERDKKLSCKSRKNLDDRYIKRLIAKHSGIPYSSIPESLVEFKRTLLLMKKAINEKRTMNLENKINEDKKC